MNLAAVYRSLTDKELDGLERAMQAIVAGRQLKPDDHAAREVATG